MATRRHTAAKIAISLPRNVLKQLDRVAREQKDTRSGFITRAILQSLRKYRDDEITNQINRALADPKVRRAERREMKLWEGVYGDWLKNWT